MERKVKYTRKTGDLEESVTFEETRTNEGLYPWEIPIRTTHTETDFSAPWKFEDSIHWAMVVFLSEIVICLSRKRFPIKRINIVSFVFTIIFLSISILIFWGKYTRGEGNEIEWLPNSYLASIILFACIIVAMFIKLYIFWQKSYVDLDYSYFDFLLKEKWNRLSIILIAEPFVFISFGTAWAFYNLYAGLIIICSGVLVWGRALYEWTRIKELARIEQKIDDLVKLTS